MIQHSDFSVSVKCKDTTEKIEPVRYDPKGPKQTDLARDHEIAQLRSVVGSLAWFQGNAGLSFHTVWTSYSLCVELRHLMT